MAYPFLPKELLDHLESEYKKSLSEHELEEYKILEKLDLHPYHQSISKIDIQHISQDLDHQLDKLTSSERLPFLMVIFKWILYPMYQELENMYINPIYLTYSSPESFIFSIIPSTPNTKRYDSPSFSSFSIMIQTKSLQIYTIEGLSPEHTIADVKLKFFMKEPNYIPEHTDFQLKELEADGMLSNERRLHSYGITDGVVLLASYQEPDLYFYEKMLTHVEKTSRMQYEPVLEKLNESYATHDTMEEVRSNEDYDKITNYRSILRSLTKSVALVKNELS
jgi:hypothetical protein